MVRFVGGRELTMGSYVDRGKKPGGIKVRVVKGEDLFVNKEVIRCHPHLCHQMLSTRLPSRLYLSYVSMHRHMIPELQCHSGGVKGPLKAEKLSREVSK